ncbi:MAG: hypothetical protein AAGA85_21565 [Bacteroidota bacterium]
MKMTQQYLLLALLLLSACATTKRPDPELIEDDGGPLEAIYVSSVPSEADLEQFRSSALRKFRDVLRLSQALVDTTYAPEIREATLLSWRRFWQLAEGSRGQGEQLIIPQLAGVNEGDVSISDFQKVGAIYRARVGADDIQFDAILVQVQKTFGKEIHLVWDVRFDLPSID